MDSLANLVYVKVFTDGNYTMMAWEPTGFVVECFMQQTMDAVLGIYARGVARNENEGAVVTQGKGMRATTACSMRSVG